MEQVDFTLVAVILATTFAIAFGALFIVAGFDSRRTKRASIFLGDTDEQIVFLFDDERLLNASVSARGVMDTAPKAGNDWARFLAVFLPRFPQLQSDIGALADDEKMTFESVDGAAVLCAEWRNGLARITLIDSESTTEQIGLDKHSFVAMERELETLRATTEHAPFLAWREMADGTITWANNAYIELADRLDPDTIIPIWPPKRLFDTLEMAKSIGGKGMRRMPLRLPGLDEDVRWFECHRAPIGEEALYTAIAADAVVRAEGELREFVQTLTKTFAHLPIGLAIFDRNRQLALFNPALTDLTLLPAEFLSMRPTLASFLDRLREKQMMPEPKDYITWRQQMAALEAAAQHGTYQETWHIPTGQIYRVTGRPHPDGAVAFLIEDISAEISLTRRFRAELETGQAVLDTLDEAVAVFSANGTLTMTNAAYTKLWGEDYEASPNEVSILDASRAWHEKCAPSPIWGEVRNFVGSTGERAEWEADARLWDGRRISCRFAPLSGGSTLVAFQAQTGTLQRLHQGDLPNPNRAIDA